MGLTKDAISTELTANPTLKTELLSSLKDDFTASLRAEGVILRTADEEKAFLTNYEKTVVPERVNAQIGEKVKAVHDQYDEDIFKLTGKKKQPNQKTYDFLKEQIEEIKKAQGKGDDDHVLKDKLEKLEAELEKRKDWVPAEKVTELETKYFTEGIQNRVSSTLDKLPIAVPAHITEEKAKQEYAAAQRNMIRTDFLNRFTAKKDSDGNIVFYAGDQIQTNTQTAKPLTEAELIAKNYAAYFVPEQKSKTGAGSGKGSKPNVDVNEASLKTKSEVMEFLKKKFEGQNIKQGNAVWNKEYTRILTEQGITE